ncbi:type IV secretory system conjugative DNA transfer family protein [Gordonia araii]|nr:type IV secretion system DNA-binding domain-containing protein [Gordonia araii]
MGLDSGGFEAGRLDVGVEISAEGTSPEAFAERATLTITGLRPSAEPHSAEPANDAIVSMLRLALGETLTIRSGVDDAGSEGLVVHLDCTESRVCDELAVVLDEAVSTERTTRVPRERHHVWHGRPESTTVGFKPRTESGRRWDTEVPVSVRDRNRLWQALINWPDGHVEVGVTAVDDAWFAMSVALVGGSEPPLGLRAALADSLPGLEFGAAVPAESFRCDESEVRLALLLPVGAAVPPGFLVAPPPGIPVAQKTVTSPRDSAMVVGTATTDFGRKVDVALGEQELLRHVHVVGATGTGKSTLLSTMVHQLAHSGHGALVLDPHGTLVDRIVAELPASAIDRCMVVRADDLEHPIPLNPLAAADDAALATAISDMGEMFYELFDPKRTGIVGPRFVDRISAGLRGLVTLRGRRASLLDVPLIFDHKGMREALMKAQTDPREVLWWRNEVRNQKSSEYGDLVGWVNSKFESFTGSPALRAILGSGYDAYDPVGAMDGGRIILVDLAKGQIGLAASRLLGYLLLNRFWVAAMNRDTDRRFHVIVDEAHAVMAGSLVNMLSEGRKFGLSVTAAHQYLGQLAPEVAEALSGNVGTSVVFRASGPHVAEHVRATGGQLDAATLANLATFHSIVTRNASAVVAPQPFTMVVDAVRETCERVDPAALMRATWNGVGHLDVRPLDPDVEYPENVAVKGKPPNQGAFLDEWLAKRKKLESQAAAQGGKPGGQVDRTVEE